MRIIVWYSLKYHLVAIYMKSNWVFLIDIDRVNLKGGAFYIWQIIAIQGDMFYCVYLNMATLPTSIDQSRIKLPIINGD